MTEENVLLTEITGFRRGFRSVVMATVGPDGTPTASYSPYASDESGDCFVLMSGLARHTRDLLGGGRVSLLFLENEEAAQNIFGRRRLTCSCLATEVTRQDRSWEPKLDLLREQQGKLVEMLRQLPDFRLFRLAPQSGSYVSGFAQAHALESAALREILGRDG